MPAKFGELWSTNGENGTVYQLTENCKNISTDGVVMAKIYVACFFLGHGVYCIALNNDVMRYDI